MVKILTEERVVNLGHKASLKKMLVLYHILGGIDMRSGKAVLFRQLLNFFGELGSHPISDELEDFGGVIFPQSSEVVFELGVASQLRPAHRCA
ncbi:hypothetical protein ES703_61248 [subsurface metagenome]